MLGLAMLATLPVPGLAVGRIVPSGPAVPTGTPRGQLMRAAYHGDLAGVRRCFLEHDRSELDLDAALDAAAATSHMAVVEFLVDFGATRLDDALIAAVVHDNVKMAAYLVSEQRPHPATNLAEAQSLAANLGATNCDWALTAAARRRHRRRQ